jgi:predicted RNase H-like HicB family nuclease
MTALDLINDLARRIYFPYLLKLFVSRSVSLWAARHAQSRWAGRGGLLYYIGQLFENPSAGFSISFPDLPGCLAVGLTLAETYDEATKSLSLHIAALANAGSKAPGPSHIEQILSDPDNRVGVAVLVPCLADVQRSD